MVTSMAPVMLRVARDKCAAMLPAAAYLRGNDSADKLVQFERDSEASKVEAMAGFRLVAGGDLPKGITGATFLTVMSETFAAELTGGLDDRKCAALDDMFASIRTLSGAEAGRFLGNIFALAIGGKKSRTPQSSRVGPYERSARPRLMTPSSMLR